MLISSLLLTLGCNPTPASTDGTGDEPDVGCEERDADGDGANACDDCADDNAAVFPDAAEVCDGVDSNCDGALAPHESDDNADGVADCLACAEAGFLDAMEGVSGRSAVESALHAATEGLSDCSYSSVTYWMFVRLDNEDSQVECVYTGRKTSVSDGKPDSEDMNTEHTWPQSWGADAPPMECDLHHLFPTDSNANAQRSNYPFGVVSSASWSEGGSKLGNNSSGTRVFEPRDAHKGNAARAMLYYAMRYGESISSSDRALYRSWSALDPVDAAEIKRSEDIGSYQAHPNPYVVCPWLVEEVTR